MSDFVECDTCRGKYGTSTLCSGCLSNRKSIESLKEAFRDVYRGSSMTHEKIRKLRRENHNLKVGIKDIVENGCQPPLVGEKCAHGSYEWEECVPCIDQALIKLLESVDGS